MRPAILVVEDDPDTLEALRDLVLHFMPETTVATARDRAAAVAAVARAPPQVALVDYRLGRDDGVDVAHALCREAGDLHCILMTGYPRLPSLAERSRPDCIRHLLHKPPDPGVLVRQLRSCVAGSCAPSL